MLAAAKHASLWWWTESTNPVLQEDVLKCLIVIQIYRTCVIDVAPTTISCKMQLILLTTYCNYKPSQSTQFVLFYWNSTASQGVKWILYCFVFRELLVLLVVRLVWVRKHWLNGTCYRTSDKGRKKVWTWTLH